MSAREASNVSWLDKYRAAERADREREKAPLRRQVKLLAMELSKARILVSHRNCCRCPDYGAEACARCWEEWSEMEAGKA